MPVQNLKSQIAHLPEQPGVYLFANEHGETIYIGKARSLRDRVRSYLGARGLHPKTDALLDEAAGLEVIVTDSVVEALALENNLVKERAPRYNVRLRDDKNYPYLQLTTNEAFPRVLVARNVERDGTYYAGPFMPASLARRTMGLTHRLFGIRSCNEVITGQPRAAVPRVRHQALHRAVRRRDLLEGAVRRGGAAHAAVLRREERRADRSADELDDGGRRGRAVRGGGASARRRANRSDAARSPAEDRHRPHGRSRRVRPAHGTGRRGRPRVRDAERQSARARGARRERGHFRIGGGNSAGLGRAVLRRSAGSRRGASVERRRRRGAARGVALGARGSPRAGDRAEARRQARPRRSRRAQRAHRLSGEADRHGLVAVRRARDAALDAGACRPFRDASSASTSRRFRAARPWRRWSCAKTARCGRATIASTAFRRRITPGRTTSPR